MSNTSMAAPAICLCYGAGDDAFLLETIKAAIQKRADSPHQSQQRCAQLPLELRRLFLLAPISRDCFVLRILLGIALGTCSRILHLRVEEIEDVLCAALQELPRLVGHSRAGAKCRV
jgi:hypothetical protein